MLRTAVTQRANHRCEYCHATDRYQIGLFELDHIQPTSRGGPTSLENLAYACPHCNDHKWAFLDGTDSTTGESVRLFNPRLDRWDEHFLRPDDATFEIHGQTPIGRATVQRLQLNHPVFVAVRRELARLGIVE
jgi:hypothetical protein